MFYRLKKQRAIDPHWIETVKGNSEIRTVVENGQLDLNGARLDVLYNNDDRVLQDGEEVIVLIDHHFWCEPVSDRQERLRQRDELAKKEKAGRRELLNQERTDAETFNANLTVPVNWRTSIKKGFSERSDRSDKHSVSVAHIEFLEPYKQGRLKRNPGDFLCSKNTGRQWSGHFQHQVLDGEGNFYDGRVSCKACLKITRRWQKE